MSKTKTNTTKPAETKPAAQQLPDGVTVMIDVPTMATDFPVLRRLDLRLTNRQAKALRMIFDGLQRDAETVFLTSERPVRMHGDAIRWLLDRIADEVDVR